jgi:hypothetical protein
MKITKAIPQRLLKSYLTDAEREELAKFKERVMTPEEIEPREIEEAEENARVVEAQKQAAIKQVKDALDDIDRKSIRAFRAGETQRLAELEAEAVELRKALK